MDTHTDDNREKQKELMRVANIERYAEIRKVLELNQDREYVLKHLKGVPEWWLDAGRRWNHLYDFKSWLFKINWDIRQPEAKNWVVAVMDYQQALFSSMNMGATGSDRYEKPKTCKAVEKLLLKEANKIGITELPKGSWALPKTYYGWGNIKYQTGKPAIVTIGENETVEFVFCL